MEHSTPAFHLATENINGASCTRAEAVLNQVWNKSLAICDLIHKDRDMAKKGCWTCKGNISRVNKLPYDCYELISA
jgi:hypothetical protein